MAHFAATRSQGQVYPQTYRGEHFMTLRFSSVPISLVDFATAEKAKAYAEEALSSPEAMKQAVADSRGDNWVITPPVGPVPPLIRPGWRCGEPVRATKP